MSTATVDLPDIPKRREPNSSAHITQAFRDDVQHVMASVLRASLAQHTGIDGTLHREADDLARTAETLETFGHAVQARALYASANRLRLLARIVEDIIPSDPLDLPF